MSNATITIDGLTYSIFSMGTRGDGAEVVALTLLGKNGKETKRHRPSVRMADGSIKVGPWSRWP